jgi:hypothetical protein
MLIAILAQNSTKSTDPREGGFKGGHGGGGRGYNAYFSLDGGKKLMRQLRGSPASVAL